MKLEKRVAVKWFIKNFVQGKEPINSWKKRMLIKLPFQIFAGYVVSGILCFEVFSTFQNQFPGVWIRDNEYSQFGYVVLGVLTVLFTMLFFYAFTPLPNRERKRREAINRVIREIEAEELIKKQRIEENKRKLAAAEERRRQSEAVEKRNEAAKARQANKPAKGRQGNKTTKGSSQIIRTARCRIPKDADDFESVCSEWMKRNGYPDAKRTAKGPDGGVDVVSARAVAQSKFHPSQKVGAPDVQALVGSRVQLKKQSALFFNYGLGYTDQAIVAARETKVLLYRLNVDKSSFELVE